jgi:CHASE3 domain sensor protein
MLDSRPVTRALYMKILGEELGDIGRWYIALPPVLLIAFLIGLFFLASAGQARLNLTNERAHRSQLREQALNEFAGLITDAESAQRGYLLTGEGAYLSPYAAAVTNVGQALDRLHDAYGSDESSPEFHQLRILTGKELGELEDGVALSKKHGISAAASILGTDVGKRTMDSIVAILATMRSEEAAEAVAANSEWRTDYRLSRWVSAAGAILNIGLVLLAIRLVYADMRRRARQAAALRGQKSELEQQVEARTRELTALSTHLQGVSEQEKSALSRELHDELGGLLVAARMDLSWLQQRLPTSDPAIEQRFKRIHESLSAGVEAQGRGRTAAHAARQHGFVHRVALAVQGNLPPNRAALHRNHPRV